ncbi:MAG: hypothetical protein II126_01065 [Erysipelotrichaceae bacterium]|nr:hypothetical protein [Erysipelotrichaceae bacterium]
MKMYKGDESMILNYIFRLIPFIYIPLTAVLVFLELMKSLYPEQWDRPYHK